MASKSKMKDVTIRGYKHLGWKPDLPDKRDKHYTSIMPKSVKLPTRADISGQCSPVEDQLKLGSCTAQAIIGNLEYLQFKFGVAAVDLSRLFVYYNERVIEGTVNDDSGAYLRDGIKSLVKWGVCVESLCPYDIANFAHKPSAAAFADAEKRQATAYFRLQTLKEMRTCLADGYPFIFGFTVYDALLSEKVKKSGILNLPTANESVRGGHAVMAVGYDDKAKRFLCRNSWGKAWGKKGYFTVPYEYLEDRDLSDDFWTVRAFEGTTAAKKLVAAAQAARRAPRRSRNRPLGLGIDKAYWAVIEILEDDPFNVPAENLGPNVTMAGIGVASANLAAAINSAHTPDPTIKEHEVSDSSTVGFFALLLADRT